MPNSSLYDLADPGATPREVAASVGVYWRDALSEALALNLDVGPVLDRGLAALAQTGVWGAKNREPSMAMWQEAGEILQFGWLQLRAREKPRGYAGDHEMLGAIYQQRVTTDPRGIPFDHYFLRLAAPRAVRNRMHLVRDRLVDLCESSPASPKKVVVAGSGSALEVADALQLMSEAAKSNLEVRLLDLDPVAISSAEQNLRPHQASSKCVAEVENLVRLPKKSARLDELGEADLVICTGFFDYLEDGPASELLSTFWKLLRPGGEALVFNFAPWNSTRTYMEWIGNWYLLYRTRQDLARLADLAGIEADQRKISAEASGIDLLLTARKPL